MTASTTGPLPAIGPTEAEWDRFVFELLQSAGSAGITDQAVDQAMLRFREWFVIAEFVGLWRAGMVRVLWRTKTQDLAVRAVARPCPERQNNSGSIRAEPLNEEWSLTASSAGEAGRHQPSGSGQRPGGGQGGYGHAAPLRRFGSNPAFSAVQRSARVQLWPQSSQA